MNNNKKIGVITTNVGLNFLLSEEDTKLIIESKIKHAEDFLSKYDSNMKHIDFLKSKVNDDENNHDDYLKCVNRMEQILNERKTEYEEDLKRYKEDK